jgi:uncharacterized lipoprotein YddW (UPF0748 family)
MKKIIIFFTIFGLILTACVPPEMSDDNSGSAAPETAAATHEIAENNTPREIVGVWISYIELSGILTRKTEAEFRAAYAEMLDNCLALGINTVYVHLRPFGDALYNSDYYPWSKYVTGTVGKVPDFDPLSVMIEETHSRSIEFHGWLNPMRIQSNSDISKIPDGYILAGWYADDSKRGKYIVRHSNQWYLNPAYDEVIELIAAGAREIVEKYPVDGLHIDDYFYPTAAASFDAAAFAEATFSTLESFRLFNCNRMVAALYSATKQANPNLLFSISPQGSITNNRTRLFADVETWCRVPGYADYIIPQLYYGFNNSIQPFADCVADWQKLVDGTDMKLVFGLAVYKIGADDPYAGDGSREWLEETEILRRQIRLVRELQNYGGVVFYSYNWLFNPTHVNDAIQKEIDAFMKIL